MKKKFYQSPFGILILISHQGKLVYCNWDSSDCNSKLESIEKICKPTEGDMENYILEETVNQLNAYFEHKLSVFSIPIQIYGTPFQNRVWEALREIEYGTTKSYSQISEACKIPGGCRAVAQACGRNPIAIIIPCHRVVSRNGNIGGYTGGIDKKRALLNHEQ